MNKTEFRKWVAIGRSPKSHAPTSYVRAIDLLSKILGEDLFYIGDPEHFKELYADLIKEQANPEGKYQGEGIPKSYGMKGFYSAAVKKYIEFLEGQEPRKNEATA